MLYFLSHPIQYFSPLFKALAEKIPLDVVYFSDASIKGQVDKGFGKEIKWDIPLLEGYSYSFLKNYGRNKSLSNRFWDVFNPGLIKTLWQTKHKIIAVNGWSYSSNWLVFIFAKLFGMQVWLRAESPLNQELRKSKKVLFLKRILLRHILFRFFVDKFLYIGTQNKAFYEYYGVHDPSRFIFTPYAVDNEKFKTEFRKIKDNKPDLRSELGLPPNKKIILFSGKYIDKKRPMDLLEAFSMLPKAEYVLVYVGEGELRFQMEEFIEKNNLENVFLTGFVNQSQISKYYAMADVFVMCSGMGETWGLSVNEAMNFELPVIVSETCGSSYDLVRNGINGFVVREGDIVGLKDSIDKILEDHNLAADMSLASKKIIDKYSIEMIVSNIAKGMIQEQMHNHKN